jgi:uroporphyrinogen-III synthase
MTLARQAATDGSVWLFSSAQALANLRRLLPGQDWSGARAVATHPRIAAAVRNAGFGVVCESRPVLAELVASIESI